MHTISLLSCSLWLVCSQPLAPLRLCPRFCHRPASQARLQVPHKCPSRPSFQCQSYQLACPSSDFASRFEQRICAHEHKPTPPLPRSEQHANKCYESWFVRMDFLSQSMPCCCLFAEFLSVRALVVNTLTPSAAPLSLLTKVPDTHRRSQSLVASSASPALPRPCTKRVSVSPVCV